MLRVSSTTNNHVDSRVCVFVFVFVCRRRMIRQYSASGWEELGWDENREVE